MQKILRNSIFLIFVGNVCLAQDVVRYGFLPPVIPEGMVGPVVFEAQATGSFIGIAFEFDGMDLPLRDDGVSPDRIAGDGIYSISFDAATIIGKLTPERVFRPFLGFLKLFNGADVILRLNVFAQVWTNDIPIVQVDTLAADVLAAPNIVNVQGTLSPGGFDARPWAQKFYTYFQDEYDFFNFIFIPAIRGNRYHFAVQNQTSGLGLAIFDNSAQYGSSGKLQGITVFPISSFFDGAESAYQHELGHQWVNFLNGTPFESGIPHWPLASVASGVMGISLAGGAGGRFPYRLIPEGPNYRLEAVTGQPVFNDLELYLMGLLPADSVSTHFVFDDQNQTPQAGGLLLGPVTHIPISDLVSMVGARNPDAVGSQKKFRLATVVISEELLSAEAISFFNYFSQRAELQQQVPFASGFATGMAIPFYLSTGGRGELNTKIGDPTTSLAGEALLPKSFVLHQNFPNPFNPSTAISYQLSAVSKAVTLTIYDQLGREVVTLVRANQPAGYYQIQWDGRDGAGQQVASGVYLYRLQAGTFMQTRKMLLIR